MVSPDYGARDTALPIAPPTGTAPAGAAPPGPLPVWIDLVNPTAEEARAVKDMLRLEIPTREEMQEIESSSRLYRESEALFLTASFLYGVENGDYGSTPISFGLSKAVAARRAVRPLLRARSRG